jgi:hypothetical protein
MGYIRKLPNKVWLQLLGLSVIWIWFELYVEPINQEKMASLKGILFLAYIIWFSAYIGSSKELRIGKKILYFILFFWLLMGLSLVAGFIFSFFGFKPF